ncbi:MAG TPA: hypothetical protein VFQ44_28255 [Streptosporangiaceae bacterium]|nr:hypothetical protein [Streptosporangiaceae bacterium]
MRRHLREAARDAGDTLPGNECLGVMIRRWEKDDGGVSERYRMHYCRAFKIPFEEFGTAPVTPPPVAGYGVPVHAGAVPGGPGAQEAHPAPPPAPRSVAPATAPSPAPSFVAPASGLVSGPASAFAAGPASGPASAFAAASMHHGAGAPASLAQQVQLTAHQSNEHAQRAERRDIGEASLEHLRSEVTRLSREYMTAEPLPLFFEMRRVREQMYSALDRKLWPRDEVELYFLLGALNSLMADTAEGIGNPCAAEELARAGLAYALAIDHRPLIAQLRLNLAVVALWTGHARRCLDLAQSGLHYLSTGPNGAQLHIMCARAAARLGDTDTTLTKIHTAAQARDVEYDDDLLAIGGQFGFSRACHHYLAGSAVAELPAAHSEAISQLDQSIQLYTAGPEPGEDHSDHCKNVARVDLATAWLKAGELEAAITTTGPVLSLPPSRRISNLPKRLVRLRTELTAPRYRGSQEARDLDEQIERFCRDTITTQLREAAGPY